MRAHFPSFCLTLYQLPVLATAVGQGRRMIRIRKERNKTVIIHTQLSTQNTAPCPLQTYHLLEVIREFKLSRINWYLDVIPTNGNQGYFYTLATNRRHIFKAIIYGSKKRYKESKNTWNKRYVKPLWKKVQTFY